jgi:hypothetical protein
LLTVNVDAMPRASSLYAATIGGRIYVYYPSAVIRAEGTTLCTRPASHAARPKPGDRLLVFALQPPEDSGHVFVYPQASRHLIFQTASGNLLLPQHLQRSLAGFSDLDTVMKRVDYELAHNAAARPTRRSVNDPAPLQGSQVISLSLASVRDTTPDANGNLHLLRGT